ncbi:MAG: dockerin type I domain-containing protein [Bacteroidota bacterium]
MKKRGFNTKKTNSALTESMIIYKNNMPGFDKNIIWGLIKYSFLLLIICLFSEFSQGQITFTQEDASCGAADGSATVSVSGGTAPYTYLWSNGGTGTSIHNLAVGSYTCFITDANGCTGQGDVFIDNKTDMQVNISGGNVSTTYCSNASPPSITLTASVTGGKPPYVCSWPSYSMVVNSSGNQTVTVTDSAQCLKSASTYVLFIPVECSSDPNDITGPEGYGQRKMVGIADKLPYTIRYENNPDFATVPAQKVTIDMPFDSTANMLSLRLGDFGFGSFIFTVPQNTTFYSKRLDVSDSLGVMVDITAGIDVQNKKAFWILESIDPNTGLVPNDANKGFLLVNDSITHRGEGFVSFTMIPKTSVHTGDSLAAEASIVFDINEAIKTNRWKNVLDAHYPSSFVNPLPAITDTNFIQISFTASDDFRGSGVKNVKLFVAKNTANYELVGTFNKDSIINIVGVEDDIYKFISIAEDNVGNVEPMKENPDTYTFLGYPKIIAGKASYQNNANTPLNNVVVYLRNINGSVMDSVNSNVSGDYDFGLKSKTTYLIEGYADFPWGGVNSTDALIVRRQVVGLSAFDSLQTKAADVNNSGIISSADALLIRKRIVGEINTFPINDWCFLRDTVKVEKFNINHTIKSLCAGDVNGSYSAVFAKSSNITLNQRGEITADRNQLINLPVICNNKLQTSAITYIMDYPDGIINIENVVSPLAGFMYKAYEGKLIFAWDSLSPMNFDKNDVLFEMNVRVNREATEKDRVLFTLDNHSEFADRNAKVIDGVSLSIPNISITPFLDYELSPNFPNPFSKSTEIRYEMPEDGFVTMKVYNVLGQEVKTIIAAKQKAGSYSLRFDGSNLDGGTYSYKIDVVGKTRKFTASHIMIIIPTN